MKIRYIENDKYFYEMVKKRLEKSGFIFVEDNSADLYLVDIVLSNNEKCYEVVNELRKEYPKSAIVLYSSHSANEMIEPGFKAGADLFINKGCYSKLLISQLEAIYNTYKRLGN